MSADIIVIVNGINCPRVAHRHPHRARLLRLCVPTLVFGLSTLTARGVYESNIVVGMAISTGGIAQMLAGM
ncbi:hypothetical protein B0H10DRAFT_2222954 [Mycena sp. CBHHK59/15]|nr:hypothetical protein B0H10DRAFT_2222954 [Mycena sp. CBHHK59/15]